MKFVKTYKDFIYGESSALKLRSGARDLFLRFKSQGMHIDKPGNWISFPYYHHVFDDEKSGFEKQLKYLKNYGDFISIDDAVSLVSGTNKLNGKYFCLSFDDGYQCLYDNMMPITAALDIPVIIYLPTDYIGLDLNRAADFKLIKDNLPGNPKLLSYLSWEQCREMLGYQVSFGSHTKSHAKLKTLDTCGIEYELSASKQIIESALGVPCIHFACPWGLVNIDFDPVVTEPIAKKLGYKTFATTQRGKTHSGDNLYLLKRDHVLAGWGNYQLRYFFSK